MSPTNENLSQAIDAVAENASKQIATSQRQHVVRSHITRAIWLLLVVPLLAVALEASRWCAGLGEGSLMPWPLIIALSVAAPALWLMFKILSRKSHVDRLRALGTMDAALGSGERVVTADQFLQAEARDGFMQAAVEDAADWVERGRQKTLDQTASNTRLGWSLSAVPTAAILIVARVLLVRSPREIQVPIDARRLIRHNASPTNRADEQPTHRQGIVANQLGIQTEPRLRCQQAIEGVPLAQFITAQ